MEQIRGSRSIRFPAFSWRAGLHPSAATWVLLQQLVVRGLVAVKFLALGRILGPAAIGSVSVALLAVAIAESLSDTGLAQAIIQGREAPTRSQLGSVLTTLATRGVFISLLLASLAPAMFHMFHLRAGELGLLQLAAIVPLIRGAMSPAYFVVQRERRFQHISAIEISASIADCSVAIGTALTGAGVYAALIGTMTGESIKTSLTWITMRPRPPLRLAWSGIGHYVRFSRWIWASSVVTLVLNQFDKVVVATLLGPAQFGAYQMSSRLAQMLLADAAIAMSQFLFPTFAAQHRQEPKKAARLFKRYLALLLCALAMVVLVLRASATQLFSLVLGKSWLGAVPLFDIFVINMAVGALIALLVAYLRAIGSPKTTTHASILQVLVLVATVPLATRHWGATGVAWSLTAGLSVSAAFMFYRLTRSK
ncbi:PST family polysaccharide export protein [Trinickia dabaoshanensis]|uniref:PST family polysaccharide export protein n=1 Tax=Trinickia dabaoshanensis TaxID=564714 RepID=A0A2N7VVR5_9BURK|nr:oligosaccharide flippase family protein [Trinickia dabaoshanensis]PMS21247.1 PST family polysaccharide export protein [Trinickia dabaoshanensis]